MRKFLERLGSIEAYALGDEDALQLDGHTVHACERVAAARRHRRQLIDLAIRVASLAIALALWEVAAWNVDPVLFTSPTKVAVAAYHMVLSGELWTYLWPSLVVLAIGFAFAVVLGIGIGLLLARFWVLDVALTVYITFLYSIPSVALVPLIVLWAGFDTTAKVIILFLFAFFPMTINTYQGVKNVDPRLIEVGRAFRCNEAQLWLVAPPENDRAVLDVPLFQTLTMPVGPWAPVGPTLPAVPVAPVAPVEESLELGTTEPERGMVLG